MYKRPNNSKTLPCKICGDEVTNVGHDAVKVTCSTCVNYSLRDFDENNPYKHLEDVQNNVGDSE